MKKNIKIVIGANFGDEGKGLATQFFSNKDTLVVCYNGGAQKGHTIVNAINERHITHHVGSGIFRGAATYLSKDYILNPIIFKKEYEELVLKGYSPIIYINKNCIFSTPFDMMINQIIEEYRGENKHGSCGLGINETVIRNEKNKYTYQDVRESKPITFEKELLKIKDNMFDRLKELGVDSLNEYWSNIIDTSSTIIYNYMQDFFFMMKNSIVSDDSVFEKYQSIIFEGAQGLLLDQNNKEYAPHLTTSNTGLDNPLDIIVSNGLENEDIEVVYITRSYITRHGVGRFDEECDKNKINQSIFDKTNVPNPYQDTLRYGILTSTIKDRVIYDFNKSNSYNFKKSIFITHLNEYDKSLKMLEECFHDFKKYYSYKELMYEEVALGLKMGVSLLF